MSSPRLRALAALVVVAAAPAALTVSADAAGAPGAGPGHGSTARGVDEPLTSTATCPAGERAISGGWEGTPGTSVPLSRRSASDAWTVETGDVGTAAEAYVVCSDVVRSKEVEVSSAFPGDSSEQLALTARCPSGLHAVGGGWDYANDSTSNSPVFTSRPVGRGWKVVAFANDGGSNALDVFAYCVRQHTDVHRVSGEPAVKPDLAHAKASCRRGETVLGGGYATSPRSDFFNNDGPDFFYYASRPARARSWRVAATNYSSFEGEVRTTAYVVCGT